MEIKKDERIQSTEKMIKEMEEEIKISKATLRMKELLLQASKDIFKEMTE